MKLDIQEEYDHAEVLIDSDNSDASKDKETVANEETVATTAVRQTTETDEPDIIDKLCTPCVRSKSTRIVRRNKSMTPTTKKLEEVHADL